KQLKDQAKKEVDDPLQAPAVAEAGKGGETKAGFGAVPEALSVTLASPAEGKYYYYQPVYWQDVCKSWHEGIYGKYASSPSTTSATGSELPFRVVRVTLPYAETQASIHWIQAGLWAVGILTVFLAMIALWIVVRYVVVKPLTH